MSFLGIHTNGNSGDFLCSRWNRNWLCQTISLSVKFCQVTGREDLHEKYCYNPIWNSRAWSKDDSDYYGVSGITQLLIIGPLPKFSNPKVSKNQKYYFYICPKLIG